MVDSTLLLSLLIPGVIVLYYLFLLGKECITCQGGSRILAIVFFLLILGAIAYVVWSLRKNSSFGYQGNHSSPEDLTDDSEDELSDEEETFAVAGELPTKFKFQEVQLELSPQSHPTNSAFRYDDFKKWCRKSHFIRKYHQAIIKALKIKKKRILAFRKTLLKDLQVGQNKSDGFSQILDKTQDLRTIEETISRLNQLLQEINHRKATLTLQEAEKNLISAVTDSQLGIESIIGRQDIKDFLALQIYTFTQNPRVFLLGFQNIALYGPPGVGKTKLAQVIGHVYARSGIILRDHVQIITSQSLTTAYVNESARLTRKLLLANLESIVIIDEAYSMTNPLSPIDHGQEALTEMVNFIDKMIGLSIIIVAGYEKEMEEKFMGANPGLPRRFPHKLRLTAYSSEELTRILTQFLRATCPEIKISSSQANSLFTFVDYINQHQPKIFANQAGDMSNLANSLARAIYGSFEKDWEEDSQAIILNGFNDFLASKGASLRIKS